jgi:hypothetical protein
MCSHRRANGTTRKFLSLLMVSKDDISAWGVLHALGAMTGFAVTGGIGAGPNLQTEHEHPPAASINRTPSSPRLAFRR